MNVHRIVLRLLQLSACVAVAGWLGCLGTVRAQEPPGGDGGQPPEGEVQPGGLGAAQDANESTEIAPPGQISEGETVVIEPGEIEVLEFLRFLADHTKLPVVVDSNQKTLLQGTITIAATIDNADDEVVKAILKANRFLVTQEELPNGRRILEVKPATPTTPGGSPTQTPIIEVKGEETRLVQEQVETNLQLHPDEIATMVFTLRFTPPQDAINSLNTLLGTKGKTSTFSIAEVKNSQMVIVTAKYGLVNYLGKLLKIIDVPVEEPERIVEIIDVENAYSAELAQLIESFLQGRGASRGRVRRPVTRTTRPGTARTTTSSALTSEEETKIIPDERTNKIIVETYSPQDMEDILMLVRELDIRFELRRLRSHIYQVRYLKADEVANDLQLVVGGSGGGLSGRRDLGQRRSSRTGGIPRVGTRSSSSRTPTSSTPGGATGVAQGDVLIVPHIATNSLIVQAEPEDYVEIINILNQIDVKRRQVFLEAALVQVSSSSSLNYTIELLAGDPSDTATRVLFETSFGLSGLDFQNFNRTIPDLASPDSVPPGALTAIMSRGKFPALISFFKTNSDSQVLATPFILADDNMPNVIQILETLFVQTTSTGANSITSTSNEAEEAGITLEITPTISSQAAVFLEMALEVSQFTGTASTANVLPPKITNTITSAVTVPDGQLFVIGGLTRETRSKQVSKVPLLGDIPLIGKLFRSEATSRDNSNLYIFLRAHILTHPEFEDGYALTDEAVEQMQEFAKGLDPTNFPKPDVEPPPPPAEDPDRPQTYRLYPQGNAQTSGIRHVGRDPRGRRYIGDPEDPEWSPTREPPTRADGGSRVEAPGSGSVEPEPRASEPPPAPDPKAVRDRAMQDSGVREDPDGRSWLVPLKSDATSRARRKRSRRSENRWHAPRGGNRGQGAVSYRY